MSEPNDCPHRTEVQRLWEAELGGRRAAAARRHLAHCAACRSECEEWERLSGLLVRGDPARPLPLERRSELKEQLLAACAATDDVAHEADGAANRPEQWSRRRRVPAWLALGGAPVAAALLLLLYAGHRAPRLEPGSPRSSRHAPTALSQPPRIAVLPGSPKPPMAAFVLRPPGAQFSPAAGKRPPRIIRGRRGARRVIGPRASALFLTRVQPSQDAGAARRTPAPAMRDNRRAAAARRQSRTRPPGTGTAARQQDRGREWAFARLRAAAPLEARVPSHWSRSPEASAPIQRIVIQVDSPAPVGVSPTTHLTIIADGNPAALGGKLIVVKSRREEPLP